MHQWNCKEVIVSLNFYVFRGKQASKTRCYVNQIGPIEKKIPFQFF